MVFTEPSESQPTQYLRIQMLEAYLRELVPGDGPVRAGRPQERTKHADLIESTLNRLYGELPAMREYVSDFPLAFKGLMDTPIGALKGAAIRALILIPYTAADDARIWTASHYLETGDGEPTRLRPRHCVAAARLALSDAGRRSKCARVGSVVHQ